MLRSPIIDISLSDHESEDSYIMVSTNSHDSHEWDEVEEMRHERDEIEEMKHEEDEDEIQQHDKENGVNNPVGHQDAKEIGDENEDVSQDMEHQQVIAENQSPHIDECHQPHYQRSEQIQPLSIDHTIDIAADTSDSADDIEEQHTISDSICICRIHYDDEDQSITSTPDISERTLSIESSILMPTPVICDMEASLEPLVDELCTISTLHESEPTHIDDIPSHVPDDIPSHVPDDTPDYPADLTSSMLTDWDHKTHDPYDTPPDLYIDSYGFMHFARDPRFCVGEHECWEAKHIHEEPFVLERSSNVWSKGITHDDISETYDDDEYSQYDITLQSKNRHKVNDFGIKKRVRGRKTGVTHTHLKLSQITSTAKPTPITPTRTPSAPIPIRHQRSPSPSSSPSTSPSASPGSHKRRGPNFYESIRGTRTRHTMAHAYHQQQQHNIDVEKSYHQSTSDDDHCHGNACNLSTCAHCRVVARRIKDQRITRDRRYERDVHVEDGWD